MISTIKGFNGYFVSDDGSVFSTHKSKGEKMKKLTLKEDKDGYMEVGMYSHGKRFFRRVHRLVASAFIDNPKKLPQVNHIDGNVKNNNTSNLEWCTCQDNLLHSFRVLGRNPSISTNKIVDVVDKRDGSIYHFSSIRDCARFIGISYEYLGRVLSGKYKPTKNHNKLKYFKVYFANKV